MQFLIKSLSNVTAGGTGKFEGLEASVVITSMPLKGNYDNITQSIGHKKGTYKIVKTQ